MFDELYQTLGTTLADVVSKQSTYRRYANTINSFAGALLGMIGVVLAQLTAEGKFDKSTAIAGAIAAITAAMATRLTKNGISTTNANEIIAELQQNYKAVADATVANAQAIVDDEAKAAVAEKE